MHFDIGLRDDEMRVSGEEEERESESTMRAEAGRWGRYRPGIKQDHNRVTEERGRKGNSRTESVELRS